MKKVDIHTIIRTVLQGLAYVNQFIAILGNSSFASSPVYQWISFGITVVVTLLTYWYNNDWSNAAITVRDIFDMMKDGKITKEEVDDFIKKYKEGKK